MDIFIHHISSFPTIIFTGLLLFVCLYWIVAIIGMVDIDIVDLDIDMDADVSSLEGFAGLLFRLGLAGVPFTIVLTFIALIAWVTSYLLMSLLIEPAAPLGTAWFMSILAGLAAFVLSIRITGFILIPLRPLFKQSKAASVNDFLGHIAVVRSSKVTSRYGEATLADGGAGLLIKIRADEALNLKRGDRVALIEFEKESHSYVVVTEQEFKYS